VSQCELRRPQLHSNPNTMRRIVKTGTMAKHDNVMSRERREPAATGLWDGGVSFIGDNPDNRRVRIHTNAWRAAQGNEN